MPSFSFYISSVNEFVSSSDIIRAFNKIGVVHRVDFTPINKHPGFKENLSGKYKSAFVHVVELFTLGEEIKNFIQTSGIYKFYPFPAGDSSEYWILSKCHNHVQDTMMNNAQIVHNCLYLEAKVEKQAEKLEEQSATIRALTEKLEGVHNIVHQLIGGLYCQKNQAQILTDHLSILFPENYGARSRFEDTDDSKWTIWPTTRQGDDCERRIDELEQELEEAIAALNQHAKKGQAQDEKIKNLQQQVKELSFEPIFTPHEEDKGPMTINELDDEELEAPRRFVSISINQMIDQRNFDETHSVSTHSSMPDLIDSDDLSEHSSLPDLEPISDAVSDVSFPDMSDTDSEVGF